MNNQRAGCIVLMAVGLYGLILSLNLPMGKWNEPGAGAFPLVVSVLLCASGVYVFLRNRTAEAIDWRDLVRRQWAPIQIVVSTAGFIAVLVPLGYLLAASLYSLVLLYWVSRYRLWSAIGLALCLGVGSWLVFGKLFETPLPTGILGF